MGYSISWLACRGLPFEAVISRLSFRTNGSKEEFTRPMVSAQTIDDLWTLVVANRCNHRIVKTPSLAELSSQCEVVACNIEEHVMYSSAECWRNGRLAWRIEHDSEQGENHLTIEGEPPDFLKQLVADTLREQAEDSEVGWFFEIPLNCAKSLVGFKHDEENTMLEYNGYQVLDPLRPERRWWEIWK